MGLFNFGKKKIKKEKKMQEQEIQTQEQYGDGNTTDPEQALGYLLHKALHGMFVVEDIVEDNHLYLPDWQLTITPVIQQLTEQSAVLGFYLECPDWDDVVYECCASAGSDPKQAMGMAIGSFLFCFMQGISKMYAKEDEKSLVTEFAGKLHNFDVYVSDIVGMGKASEVEDVNVYWELLKEDIKKRLGNQRFCCVKVYGSKVNGKVIGECRINDIQSDELSAKVAQLVEKWDVQNFASQKQFFFIKQEESTIQPYLYWGKNGKREFRDKVIKSVSMFHASDTQEAFDTLQERLVEELGDATLAMECRLFLSEICAENAFSEQIKFSETIDLIIDNNEKITLYKDQLMDYHALSKTLFTAFSEGVFGEETNTIYKEFIGTSAIYNVIEQMQEKGVNLENCQLTSLLFQVDKGFELR